MHSHPPELLDPVHLVETAPTLPPEAADAANHNAVSDVHQLALQQAEQAAQPAASERVPGETDDALDVRLANLYGSTGRDTTPYGQLVEDNILMPLLDKLVSSSGYRARRTEVAAFNASSPVLKKGLALTPLKFGISFNVVHLNQAGALVHVYRDGSIRLNHGGTEMGQGLYTKVAQVVAEVFKVDLDQLAQSQPRRVEQFEDGAITVFAVPRG